MGLRRFRPHLPHFAKKSHGKCGFRKAVGQVGLARANHMESDFNNFFLYVQIQGIAHLSLHGKMTILDPTCPKPLFYAALIGRYAKIAKPHLPHLPSSRTTGGQLSNAIIGTPQQMGEPLARWSDRAQSVKMGRVGPAFPALRQRWPVGSQRRQRFSESSGFRVSPGIAILIAATAEK
jgi:hypothetical protein